jgi:hypothetical protein
MSGGSVATVTQADDKLDEVFVESICIWEGRKPDRFFPRDQVPDILSDEAATVSESPVWVEMRLDADPTTWMDPWDPAPDAVGWSQVEEVARALGFGVPASDDGTFPRDGVAAVLQRLPRINELGELRWLDRALRRLEQSAVALPLAGLRPTSTLGEPQTEEGPLEFVLLRVNLAIVGRYVFTIRLPDRLYSGAQHCAGRRIPYSGGSPPLDEFMRHIGPDEHPSAADIGAAIALYLSATCTCVAEYARRRLIDIERKARGSPTDREGAGEFRGANHLGNLFTDVFETRGAISAAEEELVRLLQRLDETDMPAELPVTLTRYERALAELRAAEEELRLLGNWLTNRVETLQINLADQQLRLVEEQEKQARQRADEQERQAGRRQMTLAVAGTILIVP